MSTYYIDYSSNFYYIDYPTLSENIESVLLKMYQLSNISLHKINHNREFSSQLLASYCYSQFFTTSILRLY